MHQRVAAAEGLDYHTAAAAEGLDHRIAAAAEGLDFRIAAAAERLDYRTAAAAADFLPAVAGSHLAEDNRLAAGEHRTEGGAGFHTGSRPRPKVADLRTLLRRSPVRLTVFRRLAQELAGNYWSQLAFFWRKIPSRTLARFQGRSYALALDRYKELSKGPFKSRGRNNGASWSSCRYAGLVDPRRCPSESVTRLEAAISRDKRKQLDQGSPGWAAETTGSWVLQVQRLPAGANCQLVPAVRLMFTRITPIYAAKHTLVRF